MELETQVDQKRFATYFPLAQEASLLETMREGLQGIASGDCMVLSSVDGHRIAYASAPGSNTSRLAAIIGSLCALGETLGKELGQSEFKDVMISTATGIAVIQRVPAPRPRLVLMTSAGSAANVGIVSSLSRYTAEKIGRMTFVTPA